jgi:CRISPR-associated protein Csx17
LARKRETRSAAPDEGAILVTEIVLTGCRPEPLAAYLKALGVFRLVSEQCDAEARGAWRGEHFVMASRLDREGLTRFLLDEWKPTPVVAPWNGGSGFYAKDNRQARDAILASTDSRLAPTGAAMQVAQAYVREAGLAERPEAGDAKTRMLSVLRARLPDDALAWIDAAIVLGDDRLLFPPLLGTGGNDGRLEFSNNFHQRIVEVLTNRDQVRLESSLFGDAETNRFKGTMGQYLPSAQERTNPWDFILLIEGAMMFAASATRRLESNGPAMLAFPFHARAAGGLATVTDSDEGESRDELWLPLWHAPANLRSIRRLFAEGRATVGSGDDARPAVSGLDFARSVSSLGVDRGVVEFSRIGFQVRNGLSYFATPLGRFATGEVRAARLLDEIDGWYGRFRQRTTGKETPAGIAIARRRLEQAMFDAVVTDKLELVLLALGETEHTLGRSLSFTTKAFIAPVPKLSAGWRGGSDSTERRVAIALASRSGMRRRLVPLDSSTRFGRGDDPTFVFGDRPLVDNLHALLLREEVESQQTREHDPEIAPYSICTLADVARFVAGEAPRAPDVGSELQPPAAFAILKLVHDRRVDGETLPRTAGLLATACGGDAIGATSRAIRRINASSRPFPIEAIFEPPAHMRRIAAALAIPLSTKQRYELERMVLPPGVSADKPSTQQEQV